MTEKAKEIEEIMIQMGDAKQAAHLMRFFKCAPGQYGYGDRFLGIRVPATRSLVKECRNLVAGTRIPKKRSPYPYCPGAHLKNRIR